MSRYYLLFIVVLANDFFVLIPWDAFHLRDGGLLLIMLGLGYFLLRPANDNLNLEILRNPFTLLFVILLFFVTIQVSVAAFLYAQRSLEQSGWQAAPCA